MRNLNRGAYRDKKRWLSRYSELKNEVEREIEQATYWKNKAISLSGINLDNQGIRSSTPKNSTDYIIEFLEISEDCRKLAKEARRSKEEISNAIDQLEDGTTREILRMHYIDGLDFNAIARSLNYSIDWIWRLHKKALKLLKIK